MAAKAVSQLDAAGYFVAAAVADESPLEPGVFLLPGGCVDVQPPTVPAGHLARLVDGVFVLEAIPEAPPAPAEALVEPDFYIRALHELYRYTVWTRKPQEEIDAILASRALLAQRLADVQDARDDALVQAVANMTPAQLVAHIDTTFPGMTVAQRQVLKVLAKMARISARSLA